MTDRGAISRLAHELREPLSTIMLWEQILRTTRDPELRARALDAIRDSAQAQAKIIERLTSVARGSAPAI